MKLFKCLSKNVSFVQEKESEQRPKLKFRFRKQKTKTTSEEVTIARQSRGLSVRFPFGGNKQYPNNDSVDEDSIRVYVDGSANKSNQIRLVVKNTSSRTGSNILPPFYDNPVFVHDKLDQPSKVHRHSSNFNPPLNGPVMFPMEKIQLYLSSIDGYSFDDICDTGKFLDSTVTPKDRKWQVKLLGTKGRQFQDRFPHVPENDGTIICQKSSVPRSNESTLSFNFSSVNGMKRLVDYSLNSTDFEEQASDESKKQVRLLIDDSLCGPLHSTLQEAVEISNSDNPDYFNLNGRELEIDSSDENEDVNVLCSPRWSHLVVEPERLFQDADDSQVVVENIPSRDSKIKITIFRGENGFGFSLGGESPPIVARVVKDSPADKAGLMKGDEVLRVNTQRMYNKSCDHVNRFIRVIDPKYLILELSRGYRAIELRKNARDGLPEDSVLKERRSQGDGCSGGSTELVTVISKSPSEAQPKLQAVSFISKKRKFKKHEQQMQYLGTV